MSARPRTNGGQVVAALIVGTSVGTVLVAGWLFVAALFAGPPEFAPVVALGGFMYAPLPWIVGLLLVGLPVGAILHLCGARSRWTGAATGAVLSTPALSICTLTLAPTIADDAFRLAAVLASHALVGAVVGWVVAHIAYDRKGTSE
ncbi:hypothetical protein AS593_16955 [Caulobacter vibrioides]|nr:hypothetical protein AS593_16955 [Caulobacter vibrioides]